MDIYLEKKTEYFVSNLFKLSHFGISLVLSGGGGKVRKYAEYVLTFDKSFSLLRLAARKIVILV